MIIKYKFADGTVTEVEVSEEIGAVITASRRAEHALEERNRYHCYSLDAILYEGNEYRHGVHEHLPAAPGERVHLDDHGGRAAGLG